MRKVNKKNSNVDVVKQWTWCCTFDYGVGQDREVCRHCYSNRRYLTKEGAEKAALSHERSHANQARYAYGHMYAHETKVYKLRKNVARKWPCK